MTKSTKAIQPFNRKKILDATLKLKLERAKVQCKGGINPDYDVNHNDEIIDAAKSPPIYTKLENRVTNDFNKAVKRMEDRRAKLGKL